MLETYQHHMLYASWCQALCRAPNMLFSVLSCAVLCCDVMWSDVLCCPPVVALCAVLTLWRRRLLLS
jgi:hypothetical protein